MPVAKPLKGRLDLAKSSCSRLRGGFLLEQPDLQVLGAIDNLAIHGKPAVRDTQHELGSHHPFYVDVVHNLANVRQHLASQFQFAQAQGPAAAFAADPAEIKADHLPHRIQTKTAGHDRIVLEMAAKEPKVRLDVEFSPDHALA